MPAHRKLDQQHVDRVRELALGGASHREIAATLEAEGLIVDARTCGRWLARLGMARRPAPPSRARGVAGERDLGHPRVAAEDLGASEGQPGASIAVDLSPPSEEEQVLRENLAILREQVANDRLAAVDRARVSSEIRALLGRLDELALRRRAAEARRVDDGAAERVRQRLERIALRMVPVEVVTPAEQTKGGRRVASK